MVNGTPGRVQYAPGLKDEPALPCGVDRIESGSVVGEGGDGILVDFVGYPEGVVLPHHCEETALVAVVILGFTKKEINHMLN